MAVHYQPPGRLPLAPIRARAGVGSWSALAVVLRVTARTVLRWDDEGIPACEAVRVAKAVGAAPTEVWTDG